MKDLPNDRNINLLPPCCGGELLPAQQRPDFLSQILLGERFGQEGNSRFEQSALKYFRRKA